MLIARENAERDIGRATTAAGKSLGVAKGIRLSSLSF
jgi:hypothetical protein